MYEKFRELPKEKQRRIINAAMEVFGQNDYRHAITDDIAVKAGISKGLLFYYFKNKKSLYLFLFEFSEALLERRVTSGGLAGITDFFALMEYGAKMKMEVMLQYPYMMDFALRAFYSENEAVSKELQKVMQSKMEGIYQTYFSSIDWSRFRDGFSPVYLLRLLTWMTDGYLHEKRRIGGPIDLDEMMEDYHIWARMFKQLVYKEEYLDGCKND